MASRQLKNQYFFVFSVETFLLKLIFLVFTFTAEFLGVKPTLPPYLKPGLTHEDLVTGVSFASGGSGFDPLTPIVVVITSDYPSPFELPLLN